MYTNVAYVKIQRGKRERQEYLRNPDAVMSWSEVKRSILEAKG